MNNFQNYKNINYQLGTCLQKSELNNKSNRTTFPSSDTYGDGVSYKECLYNGSSENASVYPKNFIQKPNYMELFKCNDESMNNQTNNNYYSINNNNNGNYGNTSLQDERANELYKNSYVKLASSTFGYKPDLLMALFFSDSNILHLQTSIINNVKEITGKSKLFGTDEGLTIQKSDPSDLFNYLVKVYENYKCYNGSICFVSLKNNNDTKSELIKLNNSVLQEYVSKMISQLNMYVYYYKDASQIPEQLSIPQMTSMKGSRSLEYNTGFYSGNSTAVASFSQVNNIIQ